MIKNTVLYIFKHLIIFVHKHIIYYLNPLFYFISLHTPPMRPTIYNTYPIFHSFIISITTIYYANIYYLTHLLLFTPLLFNFIAYIPPMRSVIYNSYAISDLVVVVVVVVIIIIIIKQQQIPPQSYILHQHIYNTI